MSNPYAPPETDSWADIALPLGTEFLFNQKCLAVANHVELPRLCVITATRVPEQFARTTTLWWARQFDSLTLYKCWCNEVQRRACRERIQFLIQRKAGFDAGGRFS